MPIVKGGEHTKMEEGEFFAIETFGSTGAHMPKGTLNSLALLQSVSVTVKFLPSLLLLQRLRVCQRLSRNSGQQECIDSLGVLLHVCTIELVVSLSIFSRHRQRLCAGRSGVQPLHEEL